jgi:hypothetical protein
MHQGLGKQGGRSLAPWANTTTPAKKNTTRKIDMSILISFFGIRFLYHVNYRPVNKKLRKLKRLEKFFINSA